MHLLPIHARPVSDVAEGGDTQYTISQVNGGLPRVTGPWTKCRLTRVSLAPSQSVNQLTTAEENPGNYHLAQTTLSILNR